MLQINIINQTAERGFGYKQLLNYWFYWFDTAFTILKSSSPHQSNHLSILPFFWAICIVHYRQPAQIHINNLSPESCWFWKGDSFNKSSYEGLWIKVKELVFFPNTLHFVVHPFLALNQYVHKYDLVAWCRKIYIKRSV